MTRLLISCSTGASSLETSSGITSLRDTSSESLLSEVLVTMAYGNLMRDLPRPKNSLTENRMKSGEWCECETHLRSM